MFPDKLVTTYLEIPSRAEFRPAYSSDPALLILEARIPSAAFYRFLYRGVGEMWRWRDRNEWSDEQLEAQLALPNISLFVLYISGTPGGYIELDQQGERIEIAYFGLFPRFFGLGYGKHLLSYGIQRAWEKQPQRVWVHTCNLDGPHALMTYQKCGFRIYDVQEEAMPAKYIT